MTLFANMNPKAHRVWYRQDFSKVFDPGSCCHTPYLLPSILPLSYFAVNSPNEVWPFLMHIFYFTLAYSMGRKKKDQL